MVTTTVAPPASSRPTTDAAMEPLLAPVTTATSPACVPGSSSDRVLRDALEALAQGGVVGACGPPARPARQRSHRIRECRVDIADLRRCGRRPRGRWPSGRRSARPSLVERGSDEVDPVAAELGFDPGRGPRRRRPGLDRRGSVVEAEAARARDGRRWRARRRRPVICSVISPSAAASTVATPPPALGRSTATPRRLATACTPASTAESTSAADGTPTGRRGRRRGRWTPHGCASATSARTWFAQPAPSCQTFVTRSVIAACFLPAGPNTFRR